MTQIQLTTKIIINILMILLTLVAGVVLHKTGKPYNTLYFAVHKLLTVGFVIFLSIIIINHIRQIGFEITHYIFTILAMLSILTLIFSGGMMSLNKMHEIMFRIHIYSGFAFIICISGVLYLIFQSNQ